MVSLFEESATDRRDLRVGLAGMLTGVHARRVLAERGIACEQDVRVANEGVNEPLAEISPDEFSAEQRAKIDEMFTAIGATAATRLKQV